MELSSPLRQNDYTLRDITLYFLKLGTIGFGGPVALVGYMHQDLVEKFNWISEEEYREGLALAQLAPGPLAAQMAIYLGYVHYGIRGATLVGLTFVLPSFFMVVVLGWAYVRFGGLFWMQAVFYGVGSAVIGIIALSSYKLTKKTIGKNWMAWTIFLLLATTTWIYEKEIIWLILFGGLIYWYYKMPKSSLLKHTPLFAPVLLWIASDTDISDKLWKLATYFFMAGAFVFGSGLAIVPFLYGGVVKDYQWLTEQQFLDAVAVAMITPGPVVITVGFIGYLVAGLPGAIVAAVATFLPCYLFTILPAPYFKKYGKNPAIKAFVDGVTIAAIGAIVGAVAVLASRQFTDWISVSVAIVSVFVLYRFTNLKEPYLILAAALFGVIYKFILL
jgi:chromate transporter